MKNSKRKNGAEKTPHVNRFKKTNARSKQPKKEVVVETATCNSDKRKMMHEWKKLTQENNKHITNLMKKVVNKESRNCQNSLQLIEKIVTLFQTLYTFKTIENMN